MPLPEVRQVRLHTRPAPAYDNLRYWREYEYGLGHVTICYGGPNRYSSGWVMDDYGYAVLPSELPYGCEINLACPIIHH